MIGNSWPRPAVGWAETRRERRTMPETRRQEAAHGVDEHLDPVDVDTRQPRGLFVAADRVDVAAQRRSAREKGGQDGDQDHDDHRHGHAAQVTLADLEQELIARGGDRDSPW